MPQSLVPVWPIPGNRAVRATVTNTMTPVHSRSGGVIRLLPIIVSVLCAHAIQAADRIRMAVDDSRRATLPGHVLPRLQSAVDQGPVDPSLELPYVVMMLKPSSSQQADLDQLLADLQNTSSPNYHQWLTPEQYADRFGLSQADIAKIVAWLGQHGLTVKSVARGRNAIIIGGTAGQVSNAFGTQIHNYQAGGEMHYANATEPTLPAAFADVVLAIHGLHNFRLKPRSHVAKPRDIFQGQNQLSPADIATIYDVNPLYNLGINGKGIKLAIVGQTDIEMSDIEQFRSNFGLPVNDPTVLLIPGSRDPGTQVRSGDLGEADLDLELSGAMAPDAAITFVNSTDVQNSLQYAIDNNLAPILSTSYGDCELDTGRGGAQTLAALAQQANAQGQTIFAASGDAGAADCYGDGDGAAIDNSLAVDLPASTPGVTGIGGTQFNEGSGKYWSSTNLKNFQSALSYIPETAWNTTAEDDMPAASGGGASAYFSKPAWQTGLGVPADGVRDVPDVSISASPDHDGYVVLSQGQYQIIGGTSAGGPQFAGITALLEHYLVAHGIQSSPSLGNINPTLYSLASVGGVFHDITSGNNIVNPCLGSSIQGCSSASIGFNAGAGYDQVTGLGTPDVYNLVTAWHSGVVTSKKSTSLGLAASSASVTYGQTTVLTGTVTSSSTGVPTGAVAFSTGNYSLGSAAVNSSGIAKLTLYAAQLAVGANLINAQYSGDNSFDSSTNSTSVTVTSSASGAPPSITTVENAASYNSSFAPGEMVAVYGSQLTPSGVQALAPGVPLPEMMAGTLVSVDSIPASFYYLSPGQLNIQIPFNVTPNSTATLRVENNGVSSFYSFHVSTAAPAIFTTNAQGTGQGAILNTSYQLVDATHPAKPGSTYLQIYCTGLGAVSNQPSNGAPSPSSPLSQTPTLPQVTIGGVTATPIFSGLAPGYVGLYQVNVLVPASVASGSAIPVVLSMNGVTSNTVTIAVQ